LLALCHAADVPLKEDIADLKAGSAEDVNTAGGKGLSSNSGWGCHGGVSTSLVLWHWLDG